METFLNKLEILYYNILLTKKIDQKEKILNHVWDIVKYNRIFTDFVNFLYITDRDLFFEFINKFKKQSLILLIYNLEEISNYINISNDFYLTFYNNMFHIDLKTCSPVSTISNSNNEWGLITD